MFRIFFESKWRRSYRRSAAARDGRRTPFGISRTEERAPSTEEAAQAAKVIAATTAVERGDEIEFARPGPFGQYRWQRKKSDLNEMEKTVWERELRKSGKVAPRQE